LLVFRAGKIKGLARGLFIGVIPGMSNAGLK